MPGGGCPKIDEQRRGGLLLRLVEPPTADLLHGG
jgi:hypothetical protein